MFFYASKLIGFFAQPSNLMVFLIVGGLVLTRTRWAKLGRRLAIFASLAVLLCGLSPLGNVLILPLEQRFGAPNLDDQAPPDGVIILGGGVSAAISAKREQLTLNTAGERMTALLLLAKRFPKAKFVYSGGSAAIFQEKHTEAKSAKRYYRRLGEDPARLILEANSRNTVENAMFTKALVKPQPGERWLLVTSAYHMPRAVGCFRKAGFDIIPYPVDLRTTGWDAVTTLFPTVSGGLSRVDTAMREWIGLFAYWVSGRTSAFFPASK